MPAPPTSITADQVFAAFAALGQPQRWVLCGSRRDAWIVQARVAVAVVLREALGLSWPRIGKELNRCHASVLRRVKKHRGDKDVVEMVDALCLTLGCEIQKRTTSRGVGDSGGAR